MNGAAPTPQAAPASDAPPPPGRGADPGSSSAPTAPAPPNSVAAPPGPRGEERVRPQPTCQIKSVKIWLKAFIAGDIPGLTKQVPKGSHAGKTMIPGPSPANDCFLTDQRSFTPDIGAVSRAHSEIKIDVTGDPQIADQRHGCSWTTEIDCEDGDEECKGMGTVRGGKFHDLKVSEEGRTIELSLEGMASNPCFRGSPDIDYTGKIVISLSPTRETAHVSFEGLLDEFPFFEMYATVNDGAGQQIFIQAPTTGKTPRALFGGANRRVSGSVDLSCSGSAVSR